MDNEPRKIVLILGNGFDLDLGLNTRYKDFYNTDFCPKNYPAPLISFLNEQLGGNLDSVRWYDLENAFLDYSQAYNEGKIYDVLTSNELAFIKDRENKAFSCLYDERERDAFDSLWGKAYIIQNPGYFTRFIIPFRDDMLQPVLWRDKEAFRRIKEGLLHFIKTIDKPIQDNNTVASQVLLTMSKCQKAGDFVDIFTFNYTRVQMNGNIMSDIPVHYMHGCCESGKIIVGTRDDLSISKEYDFIQKGMDDSFRPHDIVTALKEADEVIIFGHSLGENDRQYFAPFFLKQASYDNPIKKSITIFTRDSESQREIKRAIQRMTDGKLSALFSINQPTIIKTNDIDGDQNELIDFLTNHNTDRHFAEEVVGKIIKKGDNSTESQ